ncbi:MAG: PCMD domain-containing protein [Muribaculaceae bacterium]
MKQLLYKANQSLLMLFTILFCVSCIKNDIPYPSIQVDFLSITTIGESSSATIDNKKLTITLNLNEAVDLTNVIISDYTITEGAKVIDPDLKKPLNLTNPVKVTLQLYQDYVWTIEANQPISRYLNLQGQVGESSIDVVGKSVTAYVSKTADLKQILVNSIKLGPSDISTMAPNLNGQVVDFTSPVKVKVDRFSGDDETWTIYVERSDVSVSTKSVDAWTNVIWAYGTAQEGENNGFEYRKSTETTWTKVPNEWVTTAGGSIKARIIHATPNTEYTVRATSGDLVGNEITVTTHGTIEIPNASLDDWWLDGKVWNPWAKGGTSFWDTGNKGASTLGESNSIPSDETWNGEPGRSAKMQTKFVGLGPIGKLAAGNLFSGDFIRVDGTNGILNFGREFTGRPTRLKGYCKYKTSPINYTNSALKGLKGRPDTAVVYMALTDWNAPYEIRTNPKNQQLFDKNAEAIIAYGEVKYGSDINNFTEFEVNLEYRATNRTPKYIVIVCTASKYGDFFTGGTESVFYLDHLWLEWDYAQ